MIHLGHNDVWDIRVAENNRDKLVTFDELWGRLKRGTPDDMAWFDGYCRMTRENYAQTYPRPWPCGSVLLGFDRRRAEVIGHRVHIDTGLCEVRFLVEGKPATLAVFADMQRDRVWMQMRDAHGRPSPAPFDRVRLIPEKGMATQESSGEGVRSFRQVLPVLGDTREKDKALLVSVMVPGAMVPKVDVRGPFVACVDVRHGLAKDLPREPAANELPLPSGFTAAAAASAGDWARYWARAGVCLGDECLERMWYYNLYFLNCATRPGVTCPGLFANWSYRNIGTAWHGDYHTNYNLEQPFWVTFSSNRVEKHIPYVDLVHFLLPVSRQWARDHYKLPGAFFPHSAYPVEMTMMPYPVPTWGAEVCETPWVVQSLWWHYLYTLDAQFLRERAFGPIREAVQFLNAYMRRLDAHGPPWNDDKFHIYPTVVPELHGLKVDPAFCADCIVDLTLIPEAPPLLESRWDDGGAGPWHVMLGDWAVDGGAYRQTRVANACFTSSYVLHRYDDFRVDVDIRINAAQDSLAWAGITLRGGFVWNDDDTRTYLVYLRSNGELGLWTQIDGTVASVAGAVPDMSAFRRLQVTLIGSHFDIRIDGSPKLTYHDPHARRSAGLVALRTCGADASFDNLILRATRPSDFDGDFDVDLSDFSLFQLCYGGPNRPPTALCTVAADLDNDDDVDLADFGRFQACFNGANNPPACL